MTTCLNFAVQQSDDNEMGFRTGTKSILSKSWRRLQMRCKKRGLLKTGSFENKAPSFEQYLMLEDDDDEEDGVSAYNTAIDEFDFEDTGDHGANFIPQWSTTTMIDSQLEASNDLCTGSFGSSDDDTDESDVNPSTVIQTTVLDESIGAFPKSSELKSHTVPTLESPSINMDDIEEICGITFLRPGDKNKRKKYRTRVEKIPATKHVSDSETEEDTSSTSSTPEEGGLNSSNDTLSTKVELGKKDRQRRSIRFSDEVVGQSLTTVHFVPWSEHEDPEWIPRPVKCRIEL